MGGKPICSLVTLGLNHRVSVENVLEFYRGMLDLSKKFKCSVAGGDIVRSPTELVISISVLGEVQKDKMVTRAGAKVGDLIFVTGELGEAQAGLELLLKWRKNKRMKFSHALTKQHLQPIPRLAESEILLGRMKLNSMIDISDGLASDLHHICEESGVGAVLWGDTVPVSSRAKTAAKILGKDPFQFALQGGEEYELLFTASSKQAERAFGIGQFKVTAIGEIVPKGQGIRLYRDSHLTKLLIKGYTHF
jgi:thiamine-monophosphate kinase